jgi:predicted lipopolysaccharide heptosyltransferase III
MLISAQHKINIPVRRILIIQLGDIGDVVWAIPAFWALKDAFPQTVLSVLVRNSNGDLLLDDPHIDKIFQVDQQSVFSGLQLLKNLRREKFDLLFDLRADDRGAFISFFSGTKMRAALYYQGIHWRNKMFTHLANPPEAKERNFGAAEQSLKIIRSFGIQETTSIPQIFVSTATNNKMGELLAAENVAAKNGYVTINPFSRWSYKEWDMDKWRQLASFIWQKYKKPVIITGSIAERKRADELAAESNSPIYNLAGKTTLREMAALLQMSHLHIGVDSAAPHIAAAVGTPTITIYGPSDWRDWAPPGDRNQVVLPDMDCSPCHKKGCDGSGRSKCLDNLLVAKVQSAVETMLNKVVSDKS